MNKFACTYCSQCGAEFGPGDAGFSSCAEHRTASCTCPHELGEDRMLTIDGMLIEVGMDGNRDDCINVVIERKGANGAPPRFIQIGGMTEAERYPFLRDGVNSLFFLAWG